MIETDKLRAGSPERLISAQPADRQEDAIERALRPKRLAEYVGQQKIREQLEIFIQAARKRNEALGAMQGLAEDIGVSDGIRQALKLLSKG